MKELPILPAIFDQAACQHADADAFFVDKGGDARPAKAICAECPIRQPCLDYALEHAIPFGVWGGATERDRRRMGVTPRYRTSVARSSVRHGTDACYSKRGCRLPACREAHALAEQHRAGRRRTA